jgi:uncharacterized protein YjbI with pentapeptide repeats
MKPLIGTFVLLTMLLLSGCGGESSTTDTNLTTVVHETSLLNSEVVDLSQNYVSLHTDNSDSNATNDLGSLYNDTFLFTLDDNITTPFGIETNQTHIERITINTQEGSFLYSITEATSPQTISLQANTVYQMSVDYNASLSDTKQLTIIGLMSSPNTATTKAARYDAAQFNAGQTCLNCTFNSGIDSGVNITGADYSGSTFNGEIDGCTFNNVTFDNVTLNSKITYQNFERDTNFNSCSFKNTQFLGTIKGALFDNCTFEGTDFSRASFTNHDYPTYPNTYGYMSPADLVGGGNFPTFHGGTLSYINFSGIDTLNEVFFIKTQIDHADFSNASLNQFSDATWEGTKITNSNFSGALGTLRIPLDQTSPVVANGNNTF